jgi:hypothetical protein
LKFDNCLIRGFRNQGFDRVDKRLSDQNARLVDEDQRGRRWFSGGEIGFDGKQRRFLVEGNGGPSWFTEYNVLAGLSSRSFGRFSYFVTKIASGRVERGLPIVVWDNPAKDPPPAGL